MSTVFDQIRSACQQVARRARDVSIDAEAVEKLATELSASEIIRPKFDETIHWTGSQRETIVYVLVLDAVNFGSGFFDELCPVDGHTEYELVASSLSAHFRKHGPFSAVELTELAPSDCARIFGQSLDDPGPRQLMTLFCRALRQLGRFVEDRFDHRFVELVDEAGHRAGRLVELLAEMSMYRDVATYDDIDVPLYKRAQITAADLHLALRGRGRGRFDDLQNLTMFADNQVPHVLRTEGILEYSDQLASTIDRGRLLEAGSRAEVEIRACALHAVEQLVRALDEIGVETTPMFLDQYLWGLGQTKPYRNRRRHRTKTIFY